MKNWTGILGLAWVALGVIPFLCVGCKAVASASSVSWEWLNSIHIEILPGIVGMVIVVFLILCLTELWIDGILSRAKKLFSKYESSRR